MGKKNSSKKPQLKHSDEGPSTENQKPSLKPKKKGSEIDEIFAGKKRKNPENDEKPPKVSSSSAANVKSNGKTRTVRNEGKKSRSNGPVEPTSRSRKRTADGLTMYTEGELGLGNPDAGGTPLCPFDCQCCF